MPIVMLNDMRGSVIHFCFIPSQIGLCGTDSEGSMMSTTSKHTTRMLTVMVDDSDMTTLLSLKAAEAISIPS